MTKLAEINGRKFRIIFDKFNSLSKEKQDLEEKEFNVDTKIRSLEWRRDKELREQKETHNKADKKFKLKTKIAIDKINANSSIAYNKIRFGLNPENDEVITGKRFEKELSKFKNIQKTKIRTIIIARNNYIRVTEIQPRKIRIKYNRLIKIEISKKEQLSESIWNLSKKMDPYYRIIRAAEINRDKIKRSKIKIREINKKYKELEKIKHVWKGMREADEYYSKKEKIQDKFITLDLEKEKLEQKINKLAREANKELYSL